MKAERIFRVHWQLGAIVVAALALSHGSSVQASGTCAVGKDACIVVNTTADLNQRDQYMSLREGLLLQGGALHVNQLTTAEAQQVHLATILGLQGAVAVNFDPAVFHEGSNVITVLPPGLGDPDHVALPPGLGDPDAPPPGQTHPDQIGMGVLNGVEVPAPVIIDGSLLSSNTAGLLLVGRGSVKGIRFQNFPGCAIEIEGQVADYVTIGSDGDGINDEAEVVEFFNNGQDVVVLPR
jgi:hypothetical protein